MTREKLKYDNLINEIKIDIGNSLYEQPEISELELEDSLVENLGVAAGDFLDAENITRQEEEDVLLEKIKEEYDFEDIKDALDDGYVPENVYFFYVGESRNFARAVEFMGPDAEKREVAAFLLSGLGRQVMISNRPSVHVDSGDIFYENDNTGENFYNFLIAQQNEEAAFMPKKISYKNSFEACISQFLQVFSIDDVDKYDLCAHKNAKYLFY